MESFSFCSPIQYSNENLTQYVHQSMGQRCLTLSVTVASVIIYGLILTVGFLGNLATAVVIVKNSSMHTATNYYLFNLALADTTVLLLGNAI